MPEFRARREQSDSRQTLVGLPFNQRHQRECSNGAGLASSFWYAIAWTFRDKLLMFDQQQLEHAVDLQQRSYRLLKWLADAVRSGLIQFESAHAFTSLPDAASSWLSEHIQNIPPDARPDRADIPTFAKFFSTYLENSFDLDTNPGKQLYSPGAHCFCPMCSWLIDAPNLKTKKIRSADKKRAHRMRSAAIQQIATEQDIAITDVDIEELLTDDSNYEKASLLAYGFDLFRRMNGIANGPAALALWRGFAWNRSGSPKPRFQLTAELILNAEDNFVRILKEQAHKSVE